MIEAFENLSHANTSLMTEVVDCSSLKQSDLDHSKSVYDRYSSAFDSFDSSFKQQQQQHHQQQQQISYLNRFQYIIMAPTSPAVKCSEETLTYLNQGQSYELKMNYSRSDTPFYAIDEKKFEPSSCGGDSKHCHTLNEFNDGLTFLSVIRLCFWDRKLQEIEHEEIKEV